MSLKNRAVAQHCPGKIQYAAKHDADAAAIAISRRHNHRGPRAKSYFCPACQSWHIGRP